VTGAAVVAATGCTLPAPPPPAPEVLAFVLDPWALAVDATTVYVSSGQNGSVVTVPVEGGTVSTLNVRTANPVAVDQQKLYWSDGTGVFACNKSDCAGSTVTVASENAGDIVAAGGTVYWSLAPSGVGSARIMKSDQTGETPGPAVQIATGGRINRFAVDEQNVYWIDQAGETSAIMRASVDGGPATRLTQIDPAPALNIAAGATSVYVTTSDGRLLEVPKAGGSSRVLLSNIGDSSSGLAADDANVYVAGGNGLVRMPAHGGPVTTLVSHLASPAGLALDDSSVYLADPAEDRILKAPK